MTAPRHNPDWLLEFRRNVRSKDGEDGILEKIFEIAGEGSRWCVELGALTGGHGSNTWHLIKGRGWSGVLIEAEREYFEQLTHEYAEVERARCVNAFISFEGESSLDAVLSRTAMPETFDLLSLDVDGNDYHIWDSMQKYRPRVVVVEFNPTIPNDVSFVQPRDMNVNQGSSLRALVELGQQKGYELVAANSDNAFFVLAGLFPKFDLDNRSLDAIHPDKSLLTYFFQLYDGTIKIAGQRELLWHHTPIDEKKLQMLPRRKRHFPNRISPSGSVRAFKEAARKMPFYPLIQKIRRMF
jgi:hypothetical protein